MIIKVLGGRRERNSSISTTILSNLKVLGLSEHYKSANIKSINIQIWVCFENAFNKKVVTSLKLE